MSSSLQRVPGCDVLVAGVECKSASQLNTQCKFLRHCVAERRGATGMTMHGVREYTARHRPMIVIIENVTGLGQHQNNDSEQDSASEDGKPSPEFEDNLAATVRRPPLRLQGFACSSRCSYGPGVQ